MSPFGCCVCASQRKHAPLVRICGSYLWSASLPSEPMVRRGLEGLTQVGSGVFCTSVLTSGSISEGEGVSFAPAMLPGCYLQRRAANAFFLVSKRAVSERHRRKTACSSHWRCTKTEGECPPPCRITGSSGTPRKASTCPPAHRTHLHPRWR